MRRLRIRVRDEEGGLEPERFVAAETPARDVVAACEALAMAGVRTVVVERPEDWRADDVVPVVDYLSAPNPGTCLVMVGVKAPVKALLQAVTAAGVVLTYGPEVGGRGATARRKRVEWLAAHAQKEAKRHGGELPPAVARHLVALVMEEDSEAGVGALEVGQEAAKLVAYAGGEPVTRQMVDRITPPHPEARTYQLTDAFIEGDATRAFGLLQDMASGSTPQEPIRIVAGLARHFRGLAEAQAMGTEATPEALTERVGIKGYPAVKLVEQARAARPGGGAAAMARAAALELDLRVSAFQELGRSRDDGLRLVLELGARDLLRSFAGG